MPHVIVKMYSGRSEQQKNRLAAAITKAVMTTLNQSEEVVSVAIEDIKDLVGSFRFCAEKRCRRQRTCCGNDPMACR